MIAGMHGLPGETCAASRQSDSSLVRESLTNDAESCLVAARPELKQRINGVVETGVYDRRWLALAD
jgi:hypothetical protein